jgi:hypothetical protein
MEDPNIWRKFFSDWPKELPRKGVLVASFDQVPFQDFFTSENFVLVQRRAPDTVGARDVIVPYSQILAIKITEVIKPKIYREAGFQVTG